MVQWNIERFSGEWEAISEPPSTHSSAIPAPYRTINLRYRTRGGGLWIGYLNNTRDDSEDM